jgi:hypothetical protein
LSAFDCIANGTRGAVCCLGICDPSAECCAADPNDTRCQDGLRCFPSPNSSGVCRERECSADADCPDGICCNGECRASECCSGIREDGHCDGGYICLEGNCVEAPSCEQDAECPSGFTCQDGTCALKAPTVRYGSKWELWAGDHRLNGATVYLRRLTDDDPRSLGTGVVGPEYAEADFKRLAGYGANLVTLSFPAIYSESAPYKLDQPLRDQLDAYLQYAKRADLFAVISFRTGPGRTEADLASQLVCQAGGCMTGGPVASLFSAPAASLWTDAKAQDAWVTLWQRAAQRYKNNPVVAGYHLMAFPDAPDASTYLNFLDRIVAGIREVDADTPILISPPGDGLPADLTNLKPFSDEKTVYLVDTFAPTRYLTQVAGAPNPLTYGKSFSEGLDGESGSFNKAWLQKLLEPALTWSKTNKKPIAIGGYGVPRWQPELSVFLTDLLALFSSAKLSTNLWQWLPASSPAGDDAFNIEYGTDPTKHALTDNALLDLIETHWRTSDVRPSNGL